MKKVQNLCAATALLLVLSISALAGHIHTDAVPPPPPPPATTTAAEQDETISGVQESAIESETLFTEIAVSLLQLLSVF
jgi:hypothetical protein